MKKNLYIFISIVLFVSLFFGCHERLSLDAFSDKNAKPNISDTLYVQLNPVWTGFNNPHDILVGREPFLYIADTDNNRIVQMDLFGQILSVKQIKKPVALAQDYRLNLFVCASFDTLIGGVQKSISGVFKIDLFSANNVLSQAKITRVFPADSSQFFRAEAREYTGVAVFFDNSYFVTRRGPDNTSIFRPDNAILKFIQIKDTVIKNGVKTVVYRDTLLGEEPNFIPTGTGLMSINQLSGITTFPRRNQDIITTQIGETNFKVQWLVYKSTNDYSGYDSKFDPSRADIDFLKPGKFSAPEDVTVDNQGNIYVVDSKKDSLYRFTSEGKEKFSFGGKSIFNEPKGVAFYDKTLYICDSKNNRILRFKLSTDQ